MTTALVVGCAECVWNDCGAALRLAKYDRIYCVKLAAVHWPGRFDVFVTLHPEWASDYRKQREARGYPMGYETVAPLESELSGKNRKAVVTRRIAYRWPGSNSSASSGIYGAKVALYDGADRVVLAGIPMDTSKHFTRGKPWNELRAFEKGLKEALPHLQGRVRSMSGRTRQELGLPDPEWLAGR